MRLHKVLKTHPNGEMDVILEAVGLFKLQNFEFQQLNKAYPAGDILLLEDLQNPPASPQMISAFTSYINDAPARELAMYNTQEPQLFEMATRNTGRPS
ncbi:MAG: hypothetical protein U5L96_21290 [Owenweeksia sp.]|nr:hypothetical protein [Owenweeksia sp.]